MLISEFDYKLSYELIAEKPSDIRSDSRLLVLNRLKKEIEHRKFFQVIDYLEKGDCLVLNNTRVIPARLIGNTNNSKDINKQIDVLLVAKQYGRDDVWEIFANPSKRIKLFSKLYFGNNELTGEVIGKLSNGSNLVKFTYNGLFYDILEKIGKMPLPPYILKKRKSMDFTFFSDKDRYQTVYAKFNGSIAAPTAGLHFTEEVINSIRKKGVKIVEVTLHVGVGTFKPIRSENIEEHIMDNEHFEIKEETSKIIYNTKKDGKRVVAVGSTVTRALEYSFLSKKLSGPTDIFIYPGFKFQVVDILITNFHLPKSTPLLMVCAFAGKDLIFNAYNEAINKKYRFFSYGDAMMIM